LAIVGHRVDNGNSIYRKPSAPPCNVSEHAGAGRTRL
jgi:hypothetical protein